MARILWILSLAWLLGPLPPQATEFSPAPQHLGVATTSAGEAAEASQILAAQEHGPPWSAQTDSRTTLSNPWRKALFQYDRPKNLPAALFPSQVPPGKITTWMDASLQEPS